MLSARLDLKPWKGAPPSAERFAGELPVLWLGDPGCGAWLQPLREELVRRGRLWAPALTSVAVPGADSVANPWAFRPDTHAPLRWGEPGRDIRDISGAPGAPEALAGVVFDGVLGGLSSQPARTLLAQVSGLLPDDAAWLALDRNGRYLGQVVRSLRQSDDERGEGRGTSRSAQEFRRLLEVAGLGISGAWGLKQGSGGRLRAAVPGDAGWPLLMLEGRRVGANAG